VLNIECFEGANPNVKKYVFTDVDAVYETVVYKYGSYKERTVICCSVQSGCPVGCVFCGTGKRFIRNLKRDEIIGQIMEVLKRENIGNSFPIKKFQIMFMSMGEPMLNIGQVSMAVYTLNEMFPKAQLLLSTMGINDKEALDEIIEMAEDINKVGLQFSLHNSIDAERNEIIPFKNKMTVREIRDYGVKWHKATKRKPYINYCVTIDNSRTEHIERMFDLFDPNVFCFTFSTICNADKDCKEDQTDYTGMYLMQSKFLDKGYDVRLFDPAGKDDIGGGCGQLWYVQEWLESHATK